MNIPTPDIDFTLTVNIQELHVEQPRERKRRVKIHIEPVSIDTRDGTMDFAERMAKRIKRIFDEMITPCEVEITGKGVWK